METAYIGIGTNLGARAGYVELARRELAALPATRLVALSPVYETEPVGPVPQGKFLNAVARIETDLTPRALLEALAGIERRAGRVPEDQRQKWGPRELDLDILLYDERVLAEPGLTVPHPHLHERWFVLRPLADLAPGLVHPVLRRTMRELLEQVKQNP